MYKKLRTWHENGIHVCGYAAEQTKKQPVFRERLILFQNLHQHFQDESETELAQHENHPTVVGLPNDGVEQHLVVELH